MVFTVGWGFDPPVRFQYRTSSGRSPKLRRIIAGWSNRCWQPRIHPVH
jgi:hypothetical protein